MSAEGNLALLLQPRAYAELDLPNTRNLRLLWTLPLMNPGKVRKISDLSAVLPSHWAPPSATCHGSCTVAAG